MSPSLGYGIPARVDGPPPIPREYGLLQAAAQPVSGVRFVTDLDGGVERWGAAEMFPYPPDKGATFDACAPASEAGAKPKGSDVATPRFGAFTVLLPIQCTVPRVWDVEEWRARGQAVFDVVQGALVEHELMSGARMGNNPFLSDGTGDFPNGNTPTSIANGIASLEEYLGTKYRGGIIHMGPQLVPVAGIGLLEKENGVLRTRTGTVVIPGAGYAEGSRPLGAHPGITGTQEWIYASGPVDIRRGDTITVPGDISEALDRSDNSLEWLIERDYLVTWDNNIHAAVLVDRCKDTC